MCIRDSVTTVFEFDFSAVAAHRKAHKDSFARDGVRLTYTAYLVAATVQALREHPLANSSWSDEGILLHRAVHLGMATAIVSCAALGLLARRRGWVLPAAAERPAVSRRPWRKRGSSGRSP